MCLDQYLVPDLFDSLCYNQSFYLRFQNLSAIIPIHLPSMSQKEVSHPQIVTLRYVFLKMRS